MRSSRRLCGVCGADLPSEAAEGLCAACLLRAALEPEPDRPTGDGSHYTVLEPLGQGGMGRVYKARDRRLDRLVAVKFLPDALNDDLDALRRFEREARIASSLNHPHICTIHDVGRDDGRPFIVMELVEGETLAERLDRGRTSPQDALRWGIQIAEALEAAHSRGIVHRDIKPSNIMIDKRGDAKILDFGLARFFESFAEDTLGSLTTMAGSILGTIPYMAPEQVSGKEAEARTDLFALGVVIYTLVAGRHPFLRETAAATVRAILEEAPPPLVEHPPLDRVLKRLLAKDPDRRPSSAAETARRLAQCEEKSLTGRSPPGPRPIRIGLSLALVLFISLLLVSFHTTLFDHGTLFDRWFAGSPGIETLAVLPFKNLSHPDDEWLAAGMTDAMIARLSEIEGLRVPSRTTITRYRDSGLSLSRIARELRADAVVEASVQVSGEEVFCRVRLIERTGERTLLGPLEFRRDFQNIAELQNSIARAVAEEIRTRLSPEEERTAAVSVSLDPEAHVSHMRGRYLLEKRDQQSLENAIAHFEAAIDRQPDYADAWAGLAAAYLLLGTTGYSSHLPEQVMPKAHDAARQALDLNEALPEAHAVLANWAMSYAWDWGLAQRHFHKALDLAPDYVEGHHWYGLFLASRGKLEQALAAIQTAVDLDPLSPITTSAKARVLYYKRDYEGASQEYTRTLDLEPEFKPALLGRGLVLLKQGAVANAVDDFERAFAKPLTPFLKLLQAASVDAPSAAPERFEPFRVEVGDLPPFDSAVLFTVLGRSDEALAQLEAAYEARSEYLMYMSVEPIFDPLREDPRFTQLLRRIGL
jgi:eukaryotic-like serine/threonine-protein kinase